MKEQLLQLSVLSWLNQLDELDQLDKLDQFDQLDQLGMLDQLLLSFELWYLPQHTTHRASTALQPSRPTPTRARQPGGGGG